MDGELFWISHIEFNRIRTLLPRTRRGRPRSDDRMVISGIFHVLSSGCAWKDAPSGYGPHRTLYNRYVRWSDMGVWREIVTALLALETISQRLPRKACVGGNEEEVNKADIGFPGRFDIGTPAFCELQRCPYVRRAPLRRDLEDSPAPNVK